MLLRPDRFSELLKAASEGDHEAQAEVHRRYGPHVVARIRRLPRQALKRLHDTQDLAQSVFVEVLRDLPRFEDRGELAFRRWLTVKADGKVASRLRKQFDKNGQFREQEVQGSSRRASDGPGPHTYVTEWEDAQRLEAALARLEPGEREVIQLRRDASRSFADVARVLDLPSADAARMRYARAMISLRREWKNG